MNVMILGGDGYLGWPTALYLSQKGHRVAIVDSGIKRRWERELGVAPLLPIYSLADRARIWLQLSQKQLEIYEGDICDFPFIHSAIQSFAPDAVIHYGEQPSAPYSMINRDRCQETQVNNITGTLNVLWCIRELCPRSHLIKLGTMGEYGTPNIDIEEGFLEITHNGRTDTLPFPKQPGSFYHLSKVHDSHNIHFACKAWQLCSTDLNQGVVYGVETDETALDPRLATSFHYDEFFGTALNRFCVQAVLGVPLTVYGTGGQTRAFLNIRDTLQCVALTLLHPPSSGKYRVFNQFTQTFTVLQLARMVQDAASSLGLDVRIEQIDNPREESESHYYNPRHSSLPQLGLKPRLLDSKVLANMMASIANHKDRIREGTMLPRVTWAERKCATG